MSRDVVLSEEEERRISAVLEGLPRVVPDCAVLETATAAPSELAVTRIYEQMEAAGFAAQDIEAALAVTGGKGGVDPTLDWLVLYTPIERLPLQFGDKRAVKAKKAATTVKVEPKKTEKPAPKPAEAPKPAVAPAAPATTESVEEMIVPTDPDDYKLPDDILAMLAQPKQQEEKPVQAQPEPQPKPAAPKEKPKKERNTPASAPTPAPQQPQKPVRTAEEIAASRALARGGRGPRVWTRRKEVAAPAAPEPVKGSYQEKEEWKKKAAAKEHQEKALKGGAFADLKPTPDEPLLPVSWTGKTPAMMLNEWCQRHKVAKPQYNGDRAPPMLHRMKVTVVNEKGVSFTAQTDCAYGSAPSAKNAAAAVAMYFLAPTEQLYKMFPPYFRDMWQAWVTRDKAAAEAEKKQGASKRTAFASQLKKQKGAAAAAAAATASQAPQPTPTPKETKEPVRTEAAPEPQDEPRKEEPKALSKKAVEAVSRRCREEYETRQRSADYQAMQAKRARLPAWAARERVVAAIEGHAVTVVTGQTGCGKSTQVPQFVLDHYDAAGRGGECSVVCTQPRRISAVTLAARVAQERCEAAGATVGHQVRLHAVRGRATRLLFCTTGILLRRLQGDATLAGVSHVVVDEVHERDLDIDVLLAVLRRLLASGRAPHLRVVLMSATVDAGRFAAYFGADVPVVDVGAGPRHAVRDLYLEDALERTAHVVAPDAPWARRTGYTTTREGSVAVTVAGRTVDVAWDDFAAGYADGAVHSAADGIDRAAYSARTIASLERLNEDRIDYDLIEDIISYIDRTEAASEKSGNGSSGTSGTPGAVLVFLPGMGEIQTLYDQLAAVRTLHWRLHVVPLHSTMTPADQQHAFAPAPAGRRKVVLATNIAETSVTIDDVVYVVDTGRVKEFRYNRARKLRALTETWVSQASATQRRGRAGRVRDGVCFHLYTRPRYAALDPYTTPEIKRIPLEELCLQILLLGLGPVEHFLAETLDPPAPDAVTTALKSLLQVGALTPVPSSSSTSTPATSTSATTSTTMTGMVLRMTPLGKHLAALPLDVHVGKMLLYGCVLGCAGTALTLAAALSTQSPFVTPFQREQEARAARAVFYAGQPYPSDHLALVAAFRQWLAARRSGGAAAERAFCGRYFVSFQRMREVSELRAQLRDTVDSLLGDTLVRDVDGGAGDNVHLVQAVLCAGLYPHVLACAYPRRAGALPRLLTRKGDEVHFHGGSVMARAPLAPSTTGRWMLYQEMVKTATPGFEKVFVRDCTPAPPRALLLLAGTPATSHARQTTLVDGWIDLHTSSRVSLLFRRLRTLLSDALEQVFRDPANPAALPVLRLISSLLSVPAVLSHPAFP